MRRKKKVAIVFGGQSTEHEVSLRSATTIIDNIDKEKYDVVLVGITKVGQWLMYQGSSDKIANGEWENIAKAKKIVAKESHENSVRDIFYKIGAETNESPIDVVILAVHGNNCEDGVLQGVIELSGLPYVGPGVLASSVCMDKVFAKVMFEKAGIPVCKYLYFTRNYIRKNELDAINKVKSELGYPCFVKPANAGSSVGVSKVYDDDGLRKAFLLASLYDKKILIEEFIDAREIECAVLGNEDPKVAVVGEAISSGDFYDYDSKYKSQESRTEIPADIEKEKSDLIREYAKKAFLALNCEGLSRIDFFVDKKSGEIFINEINTLPGFTNISMYPNNVKFFKELGINTVISATYLVSNMIEQASTVENLISSLALENNKIILTDLIVNSTYPVCNKKLVDVKIPHGIIVSCILRNDNMIVPNGSTVILPNDKLLIISSPADQQKAIDIISGGLK